jgi:hypothetical protein
MATDSAAAGIGCRIQMDPAESGEAQLGWLLVITLRRGG